MVFIVLTNERSRVQATRPRLGLLDALRLLAALVVVLYHYTAWGHQHWGTEVAQAWPLLSKFTIYGNIGVQLFFLISGFVILMSAQGKGLIHFIGSRIGRLYPAYWLAVLAAAVLTFVIWPAARDGRTTDDILPNVTMAQAGMGVRDLDGVYWTLWVELRFYLILAALLAFGLVRDRVIEWLCLLWPLLGLYLHLSGQAKAQEWIMGQYASLFCIGMLVYLLYRGGHGIYRWFLVALNTVLACYFTGIKGRADADYLSGVHIPEWHYWLLMLGCIGLLLGCVLTRLNGVHARWMVTAGMLTYPLYLIHELWGWWIIEMFSPTVNKYLLLALTTALMLVLAYLIAQYVEKPAGPWLRRGFIRSASWARDRLRELDTTGGARTILDSKYRPLSREIR